MCRINPELLQYIKENVFPEYELNEPCHQLPHAQYVIRRSLKFAEQVPSINFDMVYTIAAYHDIKVHVDRKTHNKLAAIALREDRKLLRFFSPEQIIVMSEAVEDHRASLKHEPRSVYGKIVSSGDRTASVELMLRQTHLYRIHTFKQNFEGAIEDSYAHIYGKYGNSGYAKQKMFFPDPEFDQFLKEISMLLQDKNLFRMTYMQVNNIA